MDDLERTIDMAKCGRFSRAELYTQLEKHSHDLCGPGVSPHQAFTKFVLGEGRELFELYRRAEGKDFAPTPQTTVQKKVDSWDDLVRALMRVNSCTYSKAVDLAMSSEAGRYALSKRLRSDQIATGQFTVADMQCLDTAAAEQSSWRDFHKRQPASGDVHASATMKVHEYEAELENVRRIYPRLKESQIHDYARSRKPEAWNEYKRLNKLGGGHLPQAHGQREQAGDEHPTAATSGRDVPSRAPQWRSRHSGSPPTTPEQTPERLDDTPAIKAWGGLVDHIEETTGWPHERVVSVLKSMPVGRRLLDMAAAEL
jgi:hypothetical protein